MRAYIGVFRGVPLKEFYMRAQSKLCISLCRICDHIRTVLGFVMHVEALVELHTVDCKKFEHAGSMLMFLLSLIWG